jgi:hypothetical protein
MKTTLQRYSLPLYFVMAYAIDCLPHFDGLGSSKQW